MKAIIIFSILLLDAASAIGQGQPKLIASGPSGGSLQVKYGDSIDFSVEIQNYNLASLTITASYSPMIGVIEDCYPLQMTFIIDAGILRSSGAVHAGDASCTFRLKPTQSYNGPFGGYVHFTSDSGWCDAPFGAYILKDEVQTELDAHSVLTVSPNPFMQSAVITWRATAEGIMSIRIRNVLGQTVFEDERPSSGSLESFRLNIPHLASGEYILELIQGSSIQRAKVVIRE